MTKFTEVKVYEYIQESDSFGVAVVTNDKEETRQVAASWFYEKWEAMKDNEATGCLKPQSVEDYCFAMIQEIHFREEPTDLCYTFYRVNH